MIDLSICAANKSLRRVSTSRRVSCEIKKAQRRVNATKSIRKVNVTKSTRKVNATKSKRKIRSVYVHTKKVFGRVKVWAISTSVKPESPRYLFSRSDRNVHQHAQFIQECLPFKCVPFSTIIVNKTHLKVPLDFHHVYLSEDKTYFHFNGKVLQKDCEPDPVTSDEELEGNHI